MPYNKTLEEGLKEYTDRFLKKNIRSDGSSTEYIHLQGTALDKDFQSFLTTFAEKIREGVVEEVKIGEKDNQGKDEAWCEWYKCPKCGDTMITHKQKYCGECG